MKIEVELLGAMKPVDVEQLKELARRKYVNERTRVAIDGKERRLFEVMPYLESNDLEALTREPAPNYDSDEFFNELDGGHSQRLREKPAPALAESPLDMIGPPDTELKPGWDVALKRRLTEVNERKRRIFFAAARVLSVILVVGVPIMLSERAAKERRENASHSYEYEYEAQSAPSRNDSPAVRYAPEDIVELTPPKEARKPSSDDENSDEESETNSKRHTSH